MSGFLLAAQVGCLVLLVASSVARRAADLEVRPLTWVAIGVSITSIVYAIGLS